MIIGFHAGHTVVEYGNLLLTVPSRRTTKQTERDSVEVKHKVKIISKFNHNTSVNFNNSTWTKDNNGQPKTGNESARLRIN